MLDWMHSLRPQQQQIYCVLIELSPYAKNV